MPGYSVTFSVVDRATKEIDAINRRIAAIRAPMERMSRTISRFADVTGLRKIGQGFEFIAKAATSVLRTLVEIVPVLGTITGAATLAGMAKLVDSYAAWTRQLTATADGLGLTTQQLQQFEDAMKLAGGSASDMDASLQALYKNTTDFVRGAASSDTVGWLNRLGINVRDATGHLRNMNELMPEVIDKISRIQNPADRAAAAAALLGESGAKVVEGFRQSSKGFEGFFRDASKYTELTDQQRKQLELFSEAQGRIGVAFDHLGQQISATLATNFTPLMNKLAEFVEKHSPQIIAAVDRISAKFAAWLDGVDWSKVEGGLESVMNSLGWMVTHLDTVLSTAKDIAEVFAVLWGVKAVAGVVSLMNAIGTVAGGAAAGSGLLGALGAVAAIAAPLAAIAGVVIGNKRGQESIEEQAKGMGFEKQGGSWWNPFDKIPHFYNPTTHETLTYEEMMKRQGRPAGGGGYLEKLGDRALKGPESVQPLGPAGGKSAFYDEQRQLIYDAAKRAGVAHPDVVAEVGATQAQLESGGGAHTPGGFNVYGIKSGGGVGEAGAPVSTQEEGAGGRYTTQASFARFKSKEDAADAYIAFLQKNPRHYQGVLDADTIAKGLHAQGTSGYATASNYESSLFNVQRAYGGAPNASVPPASGKINGNVDINITHRNPPPNAAVTASGTGSVTVAPPKVEFQDFASA